MRRSRLQRGQPLGSRTSSYIATLTPGKPALNAWAVCQLICEGVDFHRSFFYHDIVPLKCHFLGSSLTFIPRAINVPWPGRASVGIASSLLVRGIGIHKLLTSRGRRVTDNTGTVCWRCTSWLLPGSPRRGSVSAPHPTHRCRTGRSLRFAVRRPMTRWISGRSFFISRIRWVSACLVVRLGGSRLDLICSFGPVKIN